ncbi:hypothetical protein [Pseudodesulfovibrio pelocollis]|uniref:hypothetical protein n=1 Tax=Pseudodesulfovibrio pelocollis TaxID=3051432 RepID=UPI00255A8941|nr:hypothetical protein [Pseudodesulfovibrio sp. SB368]
MPEPKRNKERKTVTLLPAVCAAIESRVLPGSSFSERVETDLARYDRLILEGMALLRNAMSANEVLYILQRLFAVRISNRELRLWVHHGLQSRIYDPSAEDVFDDEFQIDRQILCKKIEGLSVWERLVLIEYIEQVSTLPSNEDKIKAVCEKFGGSDAI